MAQLKLALISDKSYSWAELAERFGIALAGNMKAQRDADVKWLLGH